MLSLVGVGYVQGFGCAIVLRAEWGGVEEEEKKDGNQHTLDSLMFLLQVTHSWEKTHRD